MADEGAHYGTNGGRTHLQLDALPIQLDVFDLEVDPNSGDESCVEGIFREPEVGYSMLAV